GLQGLHRAVQVALLREADSDERVRVALGGIPLHEIPQDRERRIDIAGLDAGQRVIQRGVRDRDSLHGFSRAGVRTGASGRIVRAEDAPVSAKWMTARGWTGVEVDTHEHSAAEPQPNGL